MDHVEYDYIITVLLNASVRDLQRYVDASNHSLLDELLDDLGETSRKIFVFCNVPQHLYPGLYTITASPHSIITDNGSNFISKEFQDFCEGLGINISYASVAHPQTNEQVEKANSLVGGGIKKRLLSPLERLAGAWAEELPSIL